MSNLKDPRQPQRGSAMLITLIVIASLLAGAAILVSMEVDAARSTDVTKMGMSALYCAEAGLARAAPVVAQNHALWASALAMSGSSTPNDTEPSWLGSGFDHDIDGDTKPDVAVYIKDNDDEPPPGTNDLTKDSDLTVFLVSRCIKYADSPQEVEELIRMSFGNGCNIKQQGNCNNANNGDMPQ